MLFCDITPPFSRLLRHAGGHVGPILLPRTHRGRESLVVSEVQDPLSNLYYSHMRVDALSYHSIEQMFYHLLAKHYKNITLCHKILMETDPLNVYYHLDKTFISKTRNEEIKKDIMNLCVSEKFRHWQNFRDRLESVNGKVIFISSLITVERMRPIGVSVTPVNLFLCFSLIL